MGTHRTVGAGLEPATSSMQCSPVPLSGVHPARFIPSRSAGEAPVPAPPEPDPAPPIPRPDPSPPVPGPDLPPTPAPDPASAPLDGAGAGGAP